MGDGTLALETLQITQGAIEVALQTRFVEAQAVQGLLIGDVRRGDTAVLARVPAKRPVVFVIAVLFAELIVAGLGCLPLQQIGLDGAEAAQAEVSEGHTFDEHLFGRGLGPEIAVKVLVNGGEEFGGLAVEQTDGGESVKQVIAAGAGLSFGSARSGGAKGVAAVRLNLGFGGHKAI